jgi:hypothetical protein
MLSKLAKSANMTWHQNYDEVLKRRNFMLILNSKKREQNNVQKKVRGYPYSLCTPGKGQFCRVGIWSNTQCITPVDALHTT